MESNRRELRPRIYFSPGDVVQLKQDIANKPKMVVKSVDKMASPAGGEGTSLLGVTCIWFDTTLALQKFRFNTKDLEKIKND